MGNDCCSSRKDFKASFTENERTILKFLYSDLTEAHRAKGSTKFNKDTLKYLFPENPDMSVWIYNFMITTSESHTVDYEAFENALEVLVRDPKAIELKEFRNLDKLDMLALLMIGDFTLKKGDLRQRNISYIQAFDYVRNLLKIFQYKLAVARPIDEFALKVVVDSFFQDGHDRPDWGNFIRYIRENLPFANRSLQTFFIEKFLPSQNNLTLPDLSKPSQLLNRDFIGLLYLSNIYMENLTRLQLLYSSAYTGLSFDRLAHALNGFNGSTYIILKVIPLQNGREDNFSIIGGFNKLAWKSDDDFHEDSDSCVFSLVPNFKNYYLLDNIHADQNYTYFKAGSGVGSGIGFGGTGHDDFRIWIDGTNFNKSYVRSEDHIYTPGDLINGPPGYIKILNIEVWGFSSETPSTINTSTATGLSGVSYSQPKIPSLTTTGPNYLDQAISNFENRLSKIEQERQSRGLMGSQLQSQGTSGSVQHIENIQQHEAVKKSYQPPSRGHGDLTYTSTVVSSEQNKRAVNNGDYHFSGRKTYTSTPNVNIDLGAENIERGRSTYTETGDYYNPFKNEYREKDPALLTGQKNKNYVNTFH